MSTPPRRPSPRAKSWIDSANDPASDFPIQNLPFGIFSDGANPARRAGVAIGEWILDLAVLEQAGLLNAQGRRLRQAAPERLHRARTRRVARACASR